MFNRSPSMVASGPHPFQGGWLALALSALLSFCVCLAFDDPIWALGPILILLTITGMLVRETGEFLLSLFPFLCIHHVARLNVLFSLVGILLLLLERTLDREKVRPVSGLEAALVAAAVLALHPVPFAPSVGEAFGQWVYDYAPVLLYVGLSRANMSHTVVPRTIRLLLITSLVASLSVVVDGLLHPQLRAVGLVEAMPTGVAYDLVMFVPIGLGLYASGRDRTLGAVAALLALAAVFFTGSRTPFAVALLLSLPFARGHRFALPFVGLLLVAGMIQTGGGIVSRMAAIQGEVGLIDPSTLIRIVLWGLSIQIILAHPWLGIGFGQFLAYTERVYKHHSFLLGHSHNIALEKMVQVGLPLALFYLTLIGLVLRRNWRLYRSLREQLDKSERELFLGLFLGSLAMLACGVTDAVLNGANQPLLFWVVMALMTIWIEGLSRTRARGTA